MIYKIDDTELTEAVFVVKSLKNSGKLLFHHPIEMPTPEGIKNVMLMDELPEMDIDEFKKAWKQSGKVMNSTLIDKNNDLVFNPPREYYLVGFNNDSVGDIYNRKDCIWNINDNECISLSESFTYDEALKLRDKLQIEEREYTWYLLLKND